MHEAQPQSEPVLTPLDVLRDARREIVATHGPCHAASDWLLHVTSKRIIERSSAGPVLARRLFADIVDLLGTHDLEKTEFTQHVTHRPTGTSG